MTPLVVWHTYKGAEERAIEAAAAAYEAQSGQEVSAVAVPWGAFDSKIETAVPRGNGPDVFIAGQANLGKWIAMGLLTPVDRLGVDGYQVFVLADMAPSRLGAFSEQGAIWAVPIAVKCPVLLYDPTVVVKPPATTDELLAQARALTGNGRYGLAYEASTPYYHAAWMHGFGGSLYHYGQAQLDTPEQVAALTFLRDLGDVLPVRPTAERVGQLYDDGKAPFVISGPWFVADRKRPIAAAVLPIVSATGKPAQPYLTVEAAFVPVGAKEGALDFASWLAGPEGAALRRDIGGQVVSLDAVDYPDQLRQVVKKQADTAAFLPTDPDVQNAFEAQARALRRVLRGAASPEEAAKESQAWYQHLSKGIPEPASKGPYLAMLALIGLLGAGLAGRKLADSSLRTRIAAHAADYLWVLPAALSVCLLVVVPFLTGATVSLFDHHHGTWTFVGLRNFADILLSRDWPLTSPMSFFYTLAVTVLWTVTNVTLHVGLGVGLALVLREPWVRLRAGWRAALILPWAVPNYITALIWRTMFDAQYGAVNALLGLVTGQGHPASIDWFGSFSAAFCANLATNTWLGFPFMMVVTLGALQSIPREMEEAAEVDGAGYFGRLRHVVWPLLKPALLPAVVLGSVWTFNMFNVVYLVSGGEPDGATEILISQAYRWAFSRGNLYGYAAAYAVIIFFVLLGYSRGTNRLLRRSVA